MLVVLLVLGAAPTTGAAPVPHAGWTPSHNVGAGLHGVKAAFSSCSSDKACEFVITAGSKLPYRVYAESYRHGGWSGRVQLHPPPRSPVDYSLSCAAAGSCVLVATNGYAYYLRGGHWSGPKDFYPRANGTSVDAVASVSCVSSTFCVVGTYMGNALTWNGASWSRPRATGLQSLVDVSCPTTTFCLGVSNATAYRDVASWNGSKWTVVADDPIWSTVHAVSCSSPSFCMAVGGSVTKAGDLSTTWDGTSWHTIPPPGDARRGLGFNSVSCPSATFCLSSDGGVPSAGYQRGDAEFTWNGSSWTGPHAVATGPLGYHATSSCGSAALCEGSMRSVVSLLK